MQFKKSSTSPSSRGFTLIEMIMVIIVIGVLAAGSISVLTPSLDEARFNSTLEKINAIRSAMIGDPQIRNADSRTSFGFLGDIGSIPSNAQGIASLTAIGALPAYAVNTTLRMGAGWNGPYLVDGQSGVSYTVDAWGNTLTYDATATPPVLKSLGKGNAVGGTGFESDIIVEIPTTLRLSTVDGFISNNDGTAFSGDAEIEINYPSSGVLTSSTDTIAAIDAGHFQFTNIPFGIRSLSAYKGSKAVPTATLSNILVIVDRANILVDASQLRWP